uniref:Velvet domain-containing protein n=1 Tax=Talaromyces marneffei PM1 TaxID=1077442 RepID=A0A093XPF6_TALMA
MPRQQDSRDTYSVGVSFPEILPGVQAPSHQLERLSRRQQSEQHGPHDPLMGTQKNEYNVNSSFVAPDNRLLLSPSSSSSQYSIPSSSIFSSVYPDHSSQSTYPRSPEEFYQPVYSGTERGGMSMNTSFSERRLSIARQEEPFSSTRHTGRRRSGIPMGFDRLLNPSEQTSHPAERAFVNDSPPPRLRLHIRQQPIATRACSAGEKDRRTIDPPPILQLLVTDFRPDSRTDLAILQNSRFAVACLLYSVGKPGPDGEEVLVHSSQVVEATRRRQRDDVRPVGSTSCTDIIRENKLHRVTITSSNITTRNQLQQHFLCLPISPSVQQAPIA